MCKTLQKRKCLTDLIQKKSPKRFGVAKDELIDVVSRILMVLHR